MKQINKTRTLISGSIPGDFTFELESITWTEIATMPDLKNKILIIYNNQLYLIHKSVIIFLCIKKKMLHN